MRNCGKISTQPHTLIIIIKNAFSDSDSIRFWNRVSTTVMHGAVWKSLQKNCKVQYSFPKGTIYQDVFIFFKFCVSTPSMITYIKICIDLKQGVNIHIKICIYVAVKNFST